MPITTLDSLISSLTSEKYYRFDFNFAYTGANYDFGSWFDPCSQSSASGMTTFNSFPGTSLAWTPCNETTGNGTEVFGIPHGGNTSPDTKHILNTHTIAESPTSTPQNMLLVLVDLQGYWANINLNTTSVQNLTGTPGSDLRYANGAGCRLYMVATTSPPFANNLQESSFSISYTNQAGTTGRSLFPSQIPLIPYNGIGTNINDIVHTGCTEFGAGPFLPLANGDFGVANVSTIQITNGRNATGALCLARPLLSIPLLGNYRATERNMLNDIPSLPRVMDGACLTWLFFPGNQTAHPVSGNQQVSGYIDFVWG